MKEKTDCLSDKLLIFGGKKLSGHLQVDVSKNAYLPILAATVLCDGEVFLDDYIPLTDFVCMREILAKLGVKSYETNGGLYLDARGGKNEKIGFEWTQKIRASIFLLGALLGKYKTACISYPGGCNIGSRPIDLHIKGLKSLGVKVLERHGMLYCDGSEMKCGKVCLDFPSVGATESLMMCASVLKGTTVLKNIAKEPEIVDLQNFLNAMGAKISGAGTDQIVIKGVPKLHGGQFSVMPDRIVAGTYLLAAATCGGDITLDRFVPEHNESLLSILKQSACKITLKNDMIRLKADKRLKCVENIQTFPFPFFPTDLQTPIMVLESVSKGHCKLQENIFENRFGAVPELVKMGAKIVVEGRCAYVEGVEKLYGADIFATDLRCGAGLVIAGLKAEGFTTLHNVHYIDRGYDKIEQKFQTLGADIRRI